MSKKLTRAHFSKPSEVLENKQLSKKGKITILKDWFTDEMDKMIAEEENMHDGEDSNQLQEVVLALNELGIEVGGSSTSGKGSQFNK